MTENLPQPFWSVMIPTYLPKESLLREALESILQQDPGSHEMQIEVVDDCSPGVDIVALVKSIAGERVVVSKTPKNLGLAGCWNTCIERAHGQWVHLLHQDDLVYDGFYTALKEGMVSDPEIGGAFTRVAFLDESGEQVYVSELHSASAGVLTNWVEKNAVELQMQCPAIVVRRSVYEAVGGFNSDYSYVLDWEMWLKIAFNYKFHFEPCILAGYRDHYSSTTSRLQRSGEDVRDIGKLLREGIVYHQHPEGSLLAKKARRFYSARAVRISRKFLVSGDLKGSLTQVREAVRLSFGIATIGEIISLIWLAVRLKCAEIKRFLSSRRA